jgi:hypothetical protein
MTSAVNQQGDTTMSIKTQMALSVAIALCSTSAALAYAPSKHDRFDSAASARAMVRSNQVRHSSNPAFDVYDTRGRYLGSDPDPFIRSQLARDPAKGD